VTDAAERARARTDGPAPCAPEIKDHLISIPLTMVTGRRLGACDPRRAAERGVVRTAP